MIDLAQFYKLLKAEGIDFVTGVPDTLLNDFCLGLDAAWPGAHHIIAANEGNAIALAAGYHLATDTIPLVYMQNSGLGNALNPLISLVDPAVYSIPLVLLIGWRGEPGISDWPQHQRQGELTPVLLDGLGIQYRVLEADQAMVGDAARWAIGTARGTQRPTALLVRKGVLAKKEKSGFDALTQHYALSREEVIRTILAAAPRNCIYVASTGRITRELHAIRDELGQPHDHDFLNVGAMGHTLSIAAGIATACPDRPVICLDGDGAALMHLGALAVTAKLALPNLIHVVLNNGVHESVGGQPTAGYDAKLTAIAAASGYVTLQSHIETVEELTQAISRMLGVNGPSFIEMRIRKGMRSDMPVLRTEPRKEKMALMAEISRKIRVFSDD
jgi:phosphonopyruvate decarboxylase